MVVAVEADKIINMKQWYVYVAIAILAVAIGGVLYTHHTAQIPPVVYADSKCPDDYADTDEGSAKYIADTNQWTNNFYDAHPAATLADWSAARYQFWVDNNCRTALERYDEAKLQGL